MKGCIRILGILVILVLSGCTQNKPSKEMVPDSKVQETTNKSTEQEVKTPESKEINVSKREEIPTHYKEEIDQQLSIDAQVYVPDSLTSMEFLEGIATPIIIDKEQAKNILLENVEIVEETSQVIGDQEETTYMGKEGQYLSVGGSSLHYNTELYRYLANAISANPLVNRENMNQYSTSSNLSFATREDSFQRVKTLVHGLGIEIGADYTCYSLDYETLEKEEKCEDIDGNQLKECMKESWTQQDECYYFVLNQEFQEMPIFMQGYGDPWQGIGVESSKLLVIYGSQGLVYMVMQTPYYIESGEKASQTIMDLNKAVECLKNKYELLIMSGQSKVTEISLTCMPIYDKEQHYPVIPVWIFKTAVSNNIGERETLVIFHAITGEEIY